MDGNMEKFQEKMKELLAFARKKKNVLEYQEINDFLVDLEITADNIEHIYEFLEAHNVDVLRMSDVENLSNEDDLLDESEDLANIAEAQRL